MWIRRVTRRASQRGEMSLSYIGVVAVVALLVVALLASGVPRWGDGIGRGVSRAIDRVVSWGGGGSGCGSSGSGVVAAGPAPAQPIPPVAPAPDALPDAAQLANSMLGAQLLPPFVAEPLDTLQRFLLNTWPGKISAGLLGGGAAAWALGRVLNASWQASAYLLGSPNPWLPQWLLFLGRGSVIAGAAVGLGYLGGRALGWWGAPSDQQQPQAGASPGFLDTWGGRTATGLLGTGAAALAAAYAWTETFPYPYWFEHTPDMWHPNTLWRVREVLGRLGWVGIAAGAAVGLGSAIGGPLGWLVGSSAASLITGLALSQGAIPQNPVPRGLRYPPLDRLGGLTLARASLSGMGLRVLLPRLLMGLGTAGLFAGAVLGLEQAIGNAFGWWDSPWTGQQQPPPK